MRWMWSKAIETEVIKIYDEPNSVLSSSHPTVASVSICPEPLVVVDRKSKIGILSFGQETEE